MPFIKISRSAMQSVRNHREVVGDEVGNLCFVDFKGYYVQVAVSLVGSLIAQRMHKDPTMNSH